MTFLIPRHVTQFHLHVKTFEHQFSSAFDVYTKSKPKTTRYALSNIIGKSLFVFRAHLNKSIVGIANADPKIYFRTIITCLTFQFQATIADRDHNRRRKY